MLLSLLCDMNDWPELSSLGRLGTRLSRACPHLVPVPPIALATALVGPDLVPQPTKMLFAIPEPPFTDGEMGHLHSYRAPLLAKGLILLQRRGWDLNPRGIAAHAFSRRAH
jgi:hypothetical protein